MFMGTYEHTIDSKGRMFIPADFRDELGDDVILCKWMQEKCLYLMARSEYYDFAAKTSSAAMTDDDATVFDHLLFSRAKPVKVDEQNRILISAELRNQAGLSKDVAVVGVRNRVELWDLAAWNKRIAEDEQRYLASRAKLRENGLKV